MSKRVRIEGQRFNRFVVLEYVRNHQNHSIYLCRCDCGSLKEVSGAYLRRGATKSCGCWEIERQRTRTKNKRTELKVLGSVHHALMQRCYQPGTPSYKNYGGRGISVCKEWHHMPTFRAWCLESGWQRGLQIDRINNNMGYEPDNCRFVTRKENMRNTRRSKQNKVIPIHHRQ